ncbi:MAG: YlmC/YmxH family sporulation protein [Clostridia bacterium]|nr:YlmC/YmxH family sporulation protein [Clostridia bacterium]
MNCRIVDLRNKEVINIKDGARLGYVSDVEVDTCDARLVAIVIYGRARLFGLLGREDDCIIEWSDIEVIGEDSILVNCSSRRQCGGCRRKLLENIICSL